MGWWYQLLRKGRCGVKQVGSNRDVVYRHINLERQIRHANEDIKGVMTCSGLEDGREIYDL